MNKRVIAIGAAMTALGIGFFLYMLTLAPRSNDPTAMVQAVGEASGGVGAIGLVMIVVGAFRRRR
jgi:MYXO-CTERM domain-containing protein